MPINIIFIYTFFRYSILTLPQSGQASPSSEAPALEQIILKWFIDFSSPLIPLSNCVREGSFNPEGLPAAGRGDIFIEKI